MVFNCWNQTEPLPIVSGIHGRLSHESMQHQRSARANSIRAPHWKKPNPLAPQGVRKHCAWTHPERKSRDARREVLVVFVSEISRALTNHKSIFLDHHIVIPKYFKELFLRLTWYSYSQTPSKVTRSIKATLKIKK